MFVQKFGQRKMTLEKNSHREVSASESETGRKVSKSGAPAKIGIYHMFDSNNTRFSPISSACVLTLISSLCVLTYLVCIKSKDIKVSMSF